MQRFPSWADASGGTQPDPLLAFIEPFLKGETPKGFFQDSSAR